MKVINPFDASTTASKAFNAIMYLIAIIGSIYGIKTFDCQCAVDPGAPPAVAEAVKVLDAVAPLVAGHPDAQDVQSAAPAAVPAPTDGPAAANPPGEAGPSAAHPDVVSPVPAVDAVDATSPPPAHQGSALDVIAD